MPDRHPSLLDPPVLFAHRGARAHAPENTIEAFVLARRLGATGLESDVWCTADGAAVLDHDGLVRRGLRRTAIGDLDRRALPGHVPTLEELYSACGSEIDLSLDVKDVAALDEVLRVARAASAIEHLWLCHPDMGVLASWRDRSEAVKLVHSTRLGSLGCT
ncbi:MAG: glycerophosphodiester phosphodiesterase, partial [Actinobacteria bacterium]|nr:glycerophosphodiester phosphodiesterase [Actinomycetota bacterium]